MAEHLSLEQVAEVAQGIYDKMQLALEETPGQLVTWEGESAFLPWTFESGSDGISFIADEEILVGDIEAMIASWDGQGTIEEATDEEYETHWINWRGVLHKFQIGDGMNIENH